MNGVGYFAVARAIFEKPEFKRRPKWLVAWQWLIAAAAWKAEAHRGDWGVVHVERGELATTIRALAKEWRWPKSNVECFLKWLIRQQMIVLGTTRTATRTSEGPSLPHPVSIVTVCNYDKFQKSSKARKVQPGQAEGRGPGQAPQQAFEFVEELNPQPSNQITIQQQEGRFGLIGEEGASRTKPRHLQTKMTPDGKKIWLDFGTDEWASYAAEYEQAHGVTRMPSRRIGGAGQWFPIEGEVAYATRRKRRGHGPGLPAPGIRRASRSAAG